MIRILRKYENFAGFRSCRQCSRSRIPRCRYRWKSGGLALRCSRGGNWEDFVEFVDLVVPGLVPVAS